MDKTLPTVSVIIPARNAANLLPEALTAIANQTYPHVAEVIVAAADAETADAATSFGAVVVENPSGTTPVGLNLAIAASTGEIIVRCDAQSVIPEDYIARAIETMQRSGADNVGGMQVPHGETFWERAIAAAMASPFGSGDARYRIGGEEGPVETVYLGVFKRDTLERLGGFDESFVRTQDYELNHRIRESGGTVWFDPELKVIYRPRGSLRSLGRQYYEYGKAKRQFARRHSGSLQVRQLAPPLLVVGLAIAAVASIFLPWMWLVPGAYMAGLVVGSVVAVSHAGLATLGVGPALATMHLCWGTGFLVNTD